MRSQSNKLDFTGQAIYIGMDTHKKQFTISLLGEHLSYKTFSQPPNPKVLIDYLKKELSWGRLLCCLRSRLFSILDTGRTLAGLIVLWLILVMYPQQTRRESKKGIHWIAERLPGF
jgi:hypothetical protein